MKTHHFSYLAIGEFAQQLGVSVCTVRRWCRKGKIKESFRTFGNHRRFVASLVDNLLGKPESRLSVGYARVSSHDQKSDLATQAERLLIRSDQVIQDLGSGLNCKKRGLKKLLSLLLEKKISTLTLTHKDRLLRFGHELIFQICRWAGTDVIILEEPEVVSFEEELCKDVLTLMTVFSARLYGKRSHKNQRVIA